MTVTVMIEMMVTGINTDQIFNTSSWISYKHACRLKADGKQVVLTAWSAVAVKQAAGHDPTAACNTVEIVIA